MEHELITYPTWEKYAVLAHEIGGLSTRDRRQVFQLIRSLRQPCGDVFFPAFGFTLSEFAVWYTLGDSRRRTRSKRSKKKQST